MLNVKKFLCFCSALSAATLSFAAEGEGVAPSAAKLVDFGHGWVITNSMATGWVTSAFIIFLIVFVIGKASILPGKGQSVFESIIKPLRDIFDPFIAKKDFPPP